VDMVETRLFCSQFVARFYLKVINSDMALS